MSNPQQKECPGVQEADAELSSSRAKGDHSADRAAGWSSLWDAFARGVRDNMLGEVGVQALRIGGLIYLARALQPQDFGLLKVLTVVSMFGILLVEAGIPEALIQRDDLRPEHEITAWWSTVAIALSLMVGLYFGAPWLADTMGMRGLVFGARLLCIPMLLQGLAVCARARLQRELRFAAVALANVGAEVAFLMIAVVLLFEGLPQWSLPAALGARLAVHALITLVADRRLPFGLPRLQAGHDLLGFAGTVLVGGLITTGSGNVDYLLVGRLLGSAALGYYSIAWDLFRFLPSLLHRIAGIVAFPAFCRLQNNQLELALAYRNFINYIGRVVLPVLGCIAIAAPELLASIYGSKWLPAAMPMRLLVFGLALMGLCSAIGPLYYAKGYPSFDIYLNGTHLLLIIAAVGLAAPMGLLAVCAAVSMVEATISVFGQHFVSLLLGMRLRELAAALSSAVRITVACSVATLLGKFMATMLNVKAPVVLLFVVAPPAVVFCWLEADEVLGMMKRAFGSRWDGAMDVAET
jgi:O-antigen/teichoic acid export membrane protein